MNLPEQISIINSAVGTQDRPDDGFDLISDDSIAHNDSQDETDNHKKRIVYSRDQLVDIFRLISSDYCPDWITNNLNFPKRLEKQAGEQYINKLIEYDFAAEFANWNHKIPPRKPAVDGTNIKQKMEFEEDAERNEQYEPNNGLRLNLNRGENGSNREFINKSNYNNGFNNPHHQNSNYKSNNMNSNPPNKFGNERQPMFNSIRNNENRMMDDRNDGRGFLNSQLRSRGPENLNQNFAPFRRFPNRNQNQSDHHRFNGGGSGGGFSNHQHHFNNHRQQRDSEPEWFTEGPISQHDTIELKGFDEEEEKPTVTKNHQQPPQQQHQDRPSPTSNPPQQSQFNKLNIASNHHNEPTQPSQLSPPQHQQQPQKDDFDINEFTNIDWQNVNAQHQNVDRVTIENQANSSRFARWFKEPHHQQAVAAVAINHNATEDQIKKLFSSARNPNANHNAILQEQIKQLQIKQLQQLQQKQQINLQNDFFGNLMSRNLQHPPLQQVPIRQQPPTPQQLHVNRMHQQQQQQQQQQMSMAEAVSNKTEQQLFNILQKARINVDSLIVQQNVLNKDNVIKGQAKSAEELEASLFNSGSPVEQQQHQMPSSMMMKQPPPGHHRQVSAPQQQHHLSDDLFQKLCEGLNSQTIGSSSQPQHKDAAKQDENCAINPFVLNLLDDAQKQKNIIPPQVQQHHPHHQMNQPPPSHMNRNINNNNMYKMFNHNQERREERVNPFMPTSVIRKIAKEKSSLAGPSNKGLSEANFDIVTGNHISERSILANRAAQEEQQFLQQQQNKGILGGYSMMNQPNVMQQNFAIATGNRWGNDNNSIQQHRIDSTTPNHQETADQQLNADALRNILMKATKKTQQLDPYSLFNDLASKNLQPPTQSNANQFPKVQNDNQKKLIEILQKASTNFGKAPTEVGNKINNWFEHELKRNNDHLSPIIKENAFTLEDIENS